MKGLGEREREVLRSLGGASLFEYDGARGHDKVSDPEHDSCSYDRRILLVTVDRAVERIAALEAALPEDPWQTEDHRDVETIERCYACRVDRFPHKPDCRWLAASTAKATLP